MGHLCRFPNPDPIFQAAMGFDRDEVVLPEHWGPIPQAHEEMRQLSDDQEFRFGCCWWCCLRWRLPVKDSIGSLLHLWPSYSTIDFLGFSVQLP